VKADCDNEIIHLRQCGAWCILGDSPGAVAPLPGGQGS
jgi:hypothetical protein